MEEVTLEKASQSVRDMFNKGFSAMERGNLDYAIDMFIHCVEAEPLFLRARKFLRAAEIKKLKASGKGGFAQSIADALVMPTYFTAQAMLKGGKAMEALAQSEKLLRKAPLNMMFVKVFSQAAEAAGLPEVAIQTLAMAREHYPDNTELLNWLGRLYMKTNQSHLGRECFEALVNLHPHDAEALKALKDSMAISSMARDGWSDAAATGGSFRRMIKDEKEAALLEQEAKAVRGEQDVSDLVEEVLSKIQREPENINYRRELARLYTSVKRFDDAVAALQDAQRVTGSRDPQIDNMIAGVRIQQFDEEIAALKAAGNAPGTEAMEREKQKFIYEDVKDRVARYPNDLLLKYDYGVALFERAQVNEAIQQFQLSQRNPQRRTRSLYYLAMCFKQKKQYDMAVEQLQTAAAEYAPMDETKKDILYELGQIVEISGDAKKALEYYKRVYQVDIGYKDIAQKIEKGYHP